jgi:hypothetical protein
MNAFFFDNGKIGKVDHTSMWVRNWVFICPPSGKGIIFAKNKKINIRQDKKMEFQNRKMTAYEFYWRDLKGKEHFFGILPERRKRPERITDESVLNWGKLVISSIADPNRMFYVQVNIKS